MAAFETGNEEGRPEGDREDQKGTGNDKPFRRTLPVPNGTTLTPQSTKATQSPASPKEETGNQQRSGNAEPCLSPIGHRNKQKGTGNDTPPRRSIPQTPSVCRQVPDHQGNPLSHNFENKDT